MLLIGGLGAHFVTSASTTAEATTDHDVIANLFMWNWTSVAAECTSVLGPGGYGAVQVSPPEDSLSSSGHPWWDVYQPAGYDLTSRLGTRTQFAAMVSSCHAAGVKVYVDAVINHMTGADQSTTASYGGAVFTNGSSYANPGYTSADIHQAADCPESDQAIHDWNDPTEVQQCRLSSLTDLRTESTHVQTLIAGYLNDLMGLGVDGFRVDAAKHIAATDLAKIKARLTTQPSYFVQEVMPGSTDASLQQSAYETNGQTLAFTYADRLRTAFTGQISTLDTLTSGLRPSSASTAFVANHDTERGTDTLSYKDGSQYRLATAFMLAWNYGTPNVMSSFTFTSSDQSPPSNASGYVSATACGTGWECQHRDRSALNMVGFHNAVDGDATVSNWWTDGANAIAFSRGPASAATGWIALDNAATAVAARTYTTGLAAGVYCDVLHGELSDGACTGPTVTVDASGRAALSVAAHDGVAIYTGSRVGTTSATSTTAASTATATATSTATATATTTAGATATATTSAPTATSTATASATATSSASSSTATTRVTFAVRARAASGRRVAVVGSIAALGGWSPAKAVLLTAKGATSWRAGVDLPAGTTVEYKYVQLDAAGTVVWESGANRVVTVGTTAKTVHDIWR